MDTSLANDPVLARLRTALTAAYGDRIDRVVLFGSRARGDATANSDYDVAVFLRNPHGLWDELGTLAEIETDILVATGAVVSAKPFRATAWHARTPLMQVLRREGRPL